jgi:hypothetical protein
MYKRFDYEDGDSHDISGTSRDACIAEARAVITEDGGYILDDSRSIIATDEGITDVVVRVSNDLLTHEQAQELLERQSLWWDETTGTVFVVDRDALLNAYWGGVWVAVLEGSDEDLDFGRAYVEDGEIWVAWERAQAKTPAVKPMLTRFESREAAYEAAFMAALKYDDPAAPADTEAP